MSGPWGPAGDSQAWAPWEDPPTQPRLEADRMGAELATVRQPIAGSFWLCAECNSPAFRHPAYAGECMCSHGDLVYVTEAEAEAINAKLWDTTEAVPDTLQGGNHPKSADTTTTLETKSWWRRLGWTAWWVAFCLISAALAMVAFGDDPETNDKPSPTWMAEWWGDCGPQKDPDNANHYYIPTWCEPGR